MFQTFNFKDQWVIDYGCACHMASIKDWFETFSDIEANHILFGDDHIVKPQGVGFY